jgi:hypothetical protein
MALKTLADCSDQTDFIEKITLSVALNNSNLVNNGALCRAAPLAVLCSKLSELKL